MICEQLIHSDTLQPVRPHPASQALEQSPMLPTMTISCGMCGDEWAVPINPHSEPDTDRFGPDILACPACGTITQILCAIEEQ